MKTASLHGGRNESVRISASGGFQHLLRQRFVDKQVVRETSVQRSPDRVRLVCPCRDEHLVRDITELFGRCRDDSSVEGLVRKLSGGVQIMGAHISVRQLLDPCEIALREADQLIQDAALRDLPDGPDPDIGVLRRIDDAPDLTVAFDRFRDEDIVDDGGRGESVGFSVDRVFEGLQNAVGSRSAVRRRRGKRL